MKLYFLTVEHNNIIKYTFLFHQLKITKLNKKTSMTLKVTKK
jgi:hypothetical protein